MKNYVILALIIGCIGLVGGFMLGSSMQTQDNFDKDIAKVHFGNQSIILNFRDNEINITDASGDYTRFNTANHTITSYNSTYDVKMYWWCNQSNWTLVTE